jgi:hypothetical protein
MTGSPSVQSCSGEEMEVSYWLIPVGNVGALSASQVVKSLIVDEKLFAFGEQIRAGKRIKPGDRISFYEKGKGIVAHARVATKPERQSNPKLLSMGNYPWVFRLENPQHYSDSPMVINVELRAKLDAFKGRDLAQRWSWFVQNARKITRHDFESLTSLGEPA